MFLCLVYRLGTVGKHILLEDLNQFHGANLALNYDVDQDKSYIMDAFHIDAFHC